MVAVPINPEADLCWTRKRWGRGFRYFDEAGNPIRDKKTLSRLKKLAIPPMWKEVEICPDTNGKVQATGRDLKGRKQYIYHEGWTAQRQKEKFRRLRKFGQKLPELRAFAVDHLKQKGWPREKVLSLMVLVLDETGLRIGNRQYLQENETFGLSTLRRRHLDEEDDGLVFHFKGKSNQEREVRIEDDLLVSFIQKAADQPGYEIFRYQTKDGWEAVDSDDINEFIHAHLGADYSSKFFRTWVANRTLLEVHHKGVTLKRENPRRSREKILVRLVADELGNTPAVCKSHYLHPGVLRRAVRADDLGLAPAESNSVLDTGHSASERLLLKMMRGL